MPNELQYLVDEFNNCKSFKDNNLKRQIIGFIKALKNFDKEFYSQLNHLSDLKTRLGDDELDCLISVLAGAVKIENSIVRRNVVQTLGALQVFTQEKLVDKIVPDLVELIRNEEDQEIRKEIAIVLAKIGSSNRSILKLIEPLERQQPVTQLHLITAISKLKENAAPALYQLQNILFDSHDKDVIAATISCLGEIGQKASQIAPFLIDYLKSDKDKAIRLATAQSLARIDIVENAIPYLIDGLNLREELELRVAFAQTLGKSNLDTDRIALALSTYIDDEELGPEIIEILYQMNSVSSVKALTQVLLGDNPDLVAEKFHQITLDGNWQTKTDIILDIINQKNLSARVYSSKALHLFHAMLPASESRITQEQKDLDVIELCQTLIEKAVAHKINTNLVLVIGNLISLGSRKGAEWAKEQINDYVNRHKISEEDVYQLRRSAGDTSVLESKISKLESELHASWKEDLKILQQEVRESYRQVVKQYNESVWMNRVIFTFGLIVGVLSATYFFYSLFITEKPDEIKAILSGGGTLTGFVALYTLLFYKPQKQGTEALKNLLQNKAIMLGFSQDMIFIAESLRLLSQKTSSLDDIQKGSQHIQSAYKNAVLSLEKSIN